MKKFESRFLRGREQRAEQNMWLGQNGHPIDKFDAFSYALCRVPSQDERERWTQMSIHDTAASKIQDG